MLLSVEIDVYKRQEYALDSYEVDAIDYLIKPVEAERFQKAVEKAQSYHSLLFCLLYTSVELSSDSC